MEQKRGDETMDYTRLREKIREMQDEIIGGIQDCIRIDSVGGEPEDMEKARKKRWILRCSWGKN